MPGECRDFRWRASRCWQSFCSGSCDFQEINRSARRIFHYGPNLWWHPNSWKTTRPLFVTICSYIFWHYFDATWNCPQIKLIWSLMVSWNYTPAVMSQNPPADFWRPVRKPSQRRPRPRAPRSRRRRRASASGPAALVLVACGKGMTWRPWTFPRVHGLTLTRSTRGNMVTPWPAQLPMRSLSPWAFRTCELLNKYCLGPNMIYLQVSHFRFFHTCKSVGIGMFQEWGTILFIPSGDMFGTQKGAPCLGTKWHLSQGLGMFRHV